MKALQIKIDHFFHTEDGTLVIQAAISLLTAAAIISSIWYLL